MSLAIGELFKGLGYTVKMLNVRGKKSWWDDCTPLQKIYDVIHMEDLAGELEKFDVIFEIAQLVLKPDVRKSITNKSIWVVRKPFVLTEIESMIYPLSTVERDFAGVSEAWLLNDVTSPDDTTAIETLTGLKVRHLPFVWTPILAEAQNRSIGSPQWNGSADEPFFIRMADTNQSSLSSSTIPLVILRELARKKLPVEGWALHNGENVVKSKFFKENVLKHCSDLDLSGQCVGRQRSVEWVRDRNVAVLVNLRFSRLRPVLLDLAWAGIPVIHNSPALKELGHGAERFYYTDNSVDEGVQAFQNIITDLKHSKGWFSSAKARREDLVRRWAPVSPTVRLGWLQALNHVVGTEVLTKKNVPVAPVAVGVAVAPTLAVEASTVAPTVAPTVASTVAPVTPTVVVEAPTPPVNRDESQPYTVVFSDMWDEFQPDYNFFTLLLNEAGKSMTPPRSVVGVSESDYTGPTPDLVIFGPFGERWKRFTESPKIHFTGENTRPIMDSSVNLNLGFDHLQMVPISKYMRFPLWMMYINWFAADVDRLVNPRPIPLECCTRTYEKTLDDRKKFCAFVVTNPTNPIRNMSFDILNEYKPVDSAGRLYNNIGDELFALRGGGGGELKKTKFLADYKFCITYENNSREGYCTEKFLHAKAAGAVPIYWGDPFAQRDIDMNGVIDARDFKTPSDLIEAVKAIDTNDELWKKKASVPAVSQYTVDRTRRTLSELAKQAWTLLKVNDETVKQIPRFLGVEPGSAGARLGMEYFDKVTETKPVVPETPLVVTYVTWNFLGSLQHWLGTIHAQRTAIPDLEALVFIGPDVPQETLDAIQEKFKFATFERVNSEWTPPDFPDFWEPGHYAWKIWIYNTIVNRQSLAGRMILYLDAGCVLCRWPVQWMLKAQENGICCLEDPRENNDRWCGPTFCDILKVTDEEREHKQITAGLITFRAGHELPRRFFEEAFVLAQNRNVLVGPRISGVDTTGKSYGHRQDQSILSLLVRRHRVPLHPLDNVYGDKSLRKTFEAGQCIYVHRGNFQRHVQFLPGIDDAYVINLDRRADRLEKFRTTHPDISGAVERWPATDGKNIKLTPELAKLFGANDFFWKKAVMGCAISHLGLWWKLLNENPDIQNFLIFEDDAKLVPGWQETLQLSMNHVPENYDVLYLGGILPPNRSGFNKLLQPVTKYYSKIKPHQFFGQSTPTPYFHSCAYAYIISRQGAQKVIESIQEKSGYWTSADHMLCTPCEKMNLYFLTPTIAGCYQDDDPNYANSDFNNFSRVDKFDSDLWNNDERFSREEIGINLSKMENVPFNNVDLLKEVYKKKRSEESQNLTQKEPAPPAPAPAPTPTAQSSIRAITVSNNSRTLPVRFTCLKEQNLDFSKLYECNWLFSLFGDLRMVTIDHVDLSSAVPKDCPIFILQRPHVLEATKLLMKWNRHGAKFKVLHLSDELTPPNQRDPLLIYQLPNCISILRTYIRDDFPPGLENKIHVIPLGYRWSPLNSSQNPLFRTPNIPFRENHWCFFGTDWNGRSKLLKPIIDANFIKSCKFFQNWNDPSGLTREEYMYEMTNSIFVPCPDGINPETFRFYEALEAGCIPLIVKTEKNAVWFKWVSNYIPLIANDTWEDALRVMFTLLSSPRRLEVYRDEILKGWWNWTLDLKRQGQEWVLQ
jgi:GR25 family glycosyltransferase involved in LPS biosynthesis